MAAISYGAAIASHAQCDPDGIALVCGDGVCSWGELDRASNRLARAYEKHGVGEGDFVTIGLPNGIDWFIACLATWKLGAIPNPVSAFLPRVEREALIERADPALVIGVDEVEAAGRPALPAHFEPDPALSCEPLPDRISPAEKALASGGSTGRPKLIVPATPPVFDPDSPLVMFAARRCALVPGPLYHGVPFGGAWRSLLSGAQVVVMERFDASRCLELIERHRVDRISLVPTMMIRILRLPEAERAQRDLSSLEFVLTSSAPCPAWCMQAWIDWLGAEVMNETFGSTERIGGTFINGAEWVEHPGSVGKPIAGTKIRILDPETLEERLPGEMGEIYLLPPTGAGTTYRYMGAESQTLDGGWESLGDMGYLDEDGYLYLGDRRSDMILCGGRNIYPAEVEAALEAHPQVRSSAVVGLPDDDIGQRIHAIVQVAAPIDAEELDAHLRERLVHYKVPSSIEFVEHALRDDSGKVRRVALKEARMGG